jgi:hypothetical protein
MAKNFEWHYEAASEAFLKSEGITDFCEEQAKRMTRATGMPYKADVRRGKKRVRAMARGQVDGDVIKKSKKFRDKQKGRK